MAPRSRLAAALALLIPLASLAACGDDPEAPPGQERGAVVFARTTVDVKGKPKARVVLPTGSLEVRAGDPVESLSAEDTRNLEAVTAPSGSVLVPVSWTFRPQQLEELSTILGEPQSISVELVSGGARYLLAPPAADPGGRSRDSFYVNVTGDGTDLRLKVSYAGVTQTVDLAKGTVTPGRARGLYDLAGYRARQVYCPSTGWFEQPPRTAITFACVTTTPLVTPYINGRWAPKGRTFLVVGVTGNFSNLTLFGEDPLEDRATYAVQGSKDQTVLEGARPVEVIAETSQGGVDTGFYVFEIDEPRGEDRLAQLPDTITFDRTYRLRVASVQGDMDVRERRKVRIRGRAPIS